MNAINQGCDLFPFFLTFYQAFSLMVGDDAVSRGIVSPAKESWAEKTFGLGLMGYIYVVHVFV